MIGTVQVMVAAAKRIQRWYRAQKIRWFSKGVSLTLAFTRALPMSMQPSLHLLDDTVVNEAPQQYVGVTCADDVQAKKHIMATDPSIISTWRSNVTLVTHQIRSLSPFLSRTPSSPVVAFARCLPRVHRA